MRGLIRKARVAIVLPLLLCSYTVICQSIAEHKAADVEQHEQKCGALDVQQLIQLYKANEQLHEDQLRSLLLAGTQSLSQLPSLLRLDFSSSAVTIVGDIHGQLNDMLHMLELNGRPSSSNAYIFNGDLVDRGAYSVEVFALALCMHLAHPHSVYILRGNHEAYDLNRRYGFVGEVRVKYSNNHAAVMDLFTHAFQALPVAAVVNDKAFVTHGGIFDVSLNAIANINRFKEPYTDKVMTNLLWSDPSSDPGLHKSPRGAGYLFGPDITSAFLARNHLSYIVRSHQVVREGYEVTHGGLCVTVFSAPNYCDASRNKGAVLRLEHGGDPQYVQFDAVENGGLPCMYYQRLAKEL
jgi:serine/threonine-protein phosphatase 5